MPAQKDPKASPSATGVHALVGLVLAFVGLSLVLLGWCLSKLELLTGTRAFQVQLFGYGCVLAGVLVLQPRRNGAALAGAVLLGQVFVVLYCFPMISLMGVLSLIGGAGGCALVVMSMRMWGHPPRSAGNGTDAET